MSEIRYWYWKQPFLGRTVDPRRFLWRPSKEQMYFYSVEKMGWVPLNKNDAERLFSPSGLRLSDYLPFAR